MIIIKVVLFLTSSGCPAGLDIYNYTNLPDLGALLVVLVALWFIVVGALRVTLWGGLLVGALREEVVSLLAPVNKVKLLLLCVLEAANYEPILMKCDSNFNHLRFHGDSTSFSSSLTLLIRHVVVVVVVSPLSLLAPA